MQLRNISRLHALPAQGLGMDIVIVSTENAKQEAYWEWRLRAGRGVVLKADARICCITEDWHGGAGSGLGTLYAFKKARQKILQRDNIDILESLRQGASAAIYHTAGLGKRLFPLTASEYGNKAAIKLPSLINGKHFLSILEAVIKQTAVYAPSRKGRMCVFWGDQLFIPSVPVEIRAKTHIDILAMGGKFLSEDAWSARNLSNYGLIMTDEAGRACIVEKSTYAAIKRLFGQRLAAGGKIALSLGSFSLSIDMLTALLDEFSFELAARNVKMDSDSYFWMPLTLDKETYLEIKNSEGTSPELLLEHYTRMQNFKLRFSKTFDPHVFGMTDIGENGYWWDYGTVHSYLHNNLKMCGDTPEGEAMKAFFQLDGLCSHSRIRLNRSHHSIIMGVSADQLRVSNSLLLNSDIDSLEGDNCVFYNVVEGFPLTVSKGSVRADTFLPSTGAQIKMMTRVDHDGKKDWCLKHSGNAYSYEELYQLVHEVDPLQADKFTAERHHAL
jgi:hypothetical protein